MTNFADATIDSSGLQVHIGRQAIYDGAGDVVAYELLYRDRADASRAVSRDSYATSRVLVTAWSSFGLHALIGNKAGFVNLTREFITGELPLPVSPAQVGIEIPHDVDVDRDFVAGVASLAERGFTIVLDNYRPGMRRGALLPYVTYAKVDHLNADPDTIERALEEIAGVQHVHTVAYRLEDPQAVAKAIERGFALFQGNALGHPYVLTTAAEEVDWNVVGTIVAELQTVAPDPARVAELIHRDEPLAASVRRILGVHGVGPISLTDVELSEFRDWARLLRYIAATAPHELPQRHRMPAWAA